MKSRHSRQLPAQSPLAETPLDIARRIAARHVAIAAAAGIGLVSNAALAGTYTVNQFTDTGDGTCDATCTLRDAILKSQTVAGPDIIKFTTPTTPQLITLTSDLPVITEALTITGVPGPKHALITVNGASANKMFDINTLTGVDVKIADLTMVDGDTAGQGGCILATDADLILSNVTIASCSAGTDGGAIALRGEGTLTMTDSLLYDNSATQNGGALYVFNSLPANQKVVPGVTIRNSRIAENGASGDGGGLALDSDNPVLIENTTLDGNNTGIFSDQEGGGIFVFSTGVHGKISVRNSTISDNQAEHGGGIAGNISTARLEVENSTLAENRAFYDGAGIHSNNTSGLFRIRNSTIVLNDQYADHAGATGGGGLYINDADGILLLNTIVQDNLSANTTSDDVMGDVFISENSIIEVTSGATIVGATIDSTSQLGFADHGGPTKTLALNTSGTAVDNGDATLCSAVNSNRDQRGVLRNVDAHGDGAKACDIGAYEFNGTVVTGGCPTTQPACTTVDFAKGSLSITDNPGTTTDALSLAMTGSTTATNTLFGNPSSIRGTANQVCIYANGDLVTSLSLPAGSPNDAGVNSWKLLTGGKTTFSLSTGNPDGVKTAAQTPASPVMTATNAAVKVTAGGPKFVPPRAFSNTEFLDDTTTVVAQNQLSNGTCVQVSFTAAQITSNVLGKFTALK